MNIAGKITDAQFREVVLAIWRLGRMERDLRAADMVREIKRRLLAELQASADVSAAAEGGSAERTAVRPAGAADRPGEDRAEEDRPGGDRAAGRPVPEQAARDPAAVRAGAGRAAIRDANRPASPRIGSGPAAIRDAGSPRDPADGRRSG